MRHLVNQGGIPSIIFAPGCFGQAHKIDEYIELDTYTACIEHLIEMIVSWCNLEAETVPIAADEEANCR
jgi:acetylornithine deacetylase